MTRLFTFNSNLTSRTIIPWGAVWAAVCLLVVEGAVRLGDPVIMVPFEEHSLYHPRAIRHYTQLLDPPDICFVGASCTLYGISCDDVEQVLLTRTGRRLEVRNYGIRRAFAEQTAPMVRFIASQKQVPAMIALDVTPLQVTHFPDSASQGVLHTAHSAVFWNLPDWLDARARFGADVDRHLPAVIRNEIGNYYRTLRYSERPTVLLRDLYRSFKGETLANRVLGGCPAIPDESHAGPTTLAERRHESERFLKSIMYDGEFRMFDEKFAFVRDMLDVCRHRGIHVVLFEVPERDDYTQAFPNDIRDRYIHRIEAIAENLDVPFIREQELPVRIDDDCFVDPIHLNNVGAARMSRALAAVMPLPRD